MLTGRKGAKLEIFIQRRSCFNIHKNYSSKQRLLADYLDSSEAAQTLFRHLAEPSTCLANAVMHQDSSRLDSLAMTPLGGARRAVEEMELYID